MKKNKKVVIITVSTTLALVLILLSTFFIFTIIGRHQFHKDDANIVNDTVTIEDDSKITYNGKNYTLNKNMVSILVLGVDRNNLNDDLGVGNNGQADVIFLATIDAKTKNACVIPISRETMVDVNLYTTDGSFAGTKKEQICMAYAYGATPEECSKNVVISVKRLLYGININSYVTVEMDAISKLTDMLGGIEVNCIEYIPSNEFSFVEGQNIKLNGKSAISYIRYRGEDNEANARRMLRHKQFLSELLNKTSNAIMKDYSNLSVFYSSLSPYFSTNISFPQMTYLAQNCLSMNLGDHLNYKTIDGTLTKGEKWIEFTADEESVLQNVIDVFYIPIEE